MSYQIPQTTVRIWRNGDSTYAYNGKGQSELVYREPAPSPVVVDQEGTTLIGVKKRGASVVDTRRFHAAIDETMAEVDAKAAAWRALQNRKTTAQLRRQDRRYRMAGLALVVLSAAISIWTLAVLIRWAGSLH